LSRPRQRLLNSPSRMGTLKAKNWSVVCNSLWGISVLLPREGWKKAIYKCSIIREDWYGSWVCKLFPMLIIGSHVLPKKYKKIITTSNAYKFGWVPYIWRVKWAHLKSVGKKDKYRILIKEDDLIQLYIQTNQIVIYHMFRGSNLHGTDILCFSIMLFNHTSTSND
jgi:hypothetical protein